MICAIVLAAGQSQRMGVPKLLLPFGGKSVIAHIVDELLQSDLAKVCVVVGHERDRIVAALSGRLVSIAVNPHPEAGMLSSVRCGLQAMADDCDAVLVALGDQPAITAKLINEMIGAFSAGPKGILVPVYQGERGHPILFSTRYCPEILARYDDVGLRGLLRAHPDDVFEMSASSAAVLSDMDLPEDYKRELAAFNEKRRNDLKL